MKKTMSSTKGFSVSGKILFAASVAYGSAMIVYGRHVLSQLKLQAVTVMCVAGLPRLPQKRSTNQAIRVASSSFPRDGTTVYPTLV
jgi:hypothetical protein